MVPYNAISVKDCALVYQVPVENSSLLPREKIERLGPSAMSNEELLALILGSGCQNCDVLNCPGIWQIFFLLNRRFLRFSVCVRSRGWAV